MDISQPTVSQHLRRLKSLGLTTERRDGQRITYSFSQTVFDENIKSLTHFLNASIKDISAMRKEYERYELVAGGKMDYYPGQIVKKQDIGGQ